MKGYEVIGLFKYKYLNLVLFFVVLFAAFMNYKTWSHSNGSANAVAQEGEARLENPSKTELMAVNEEPGSAQFYSIIAEKNIFSPERKDFLSPVSNLTEQSRSVARPQVILSGIVIFGDYQAASVSSPGRPLRKGEREAMTLKIGDKIGDYKLARIADDRITMESSGNSFEVLLYDSKKIRKRVELRTAEVTSSGPKSPQPVTATAPKVDPAKAESTEKPAEPAQERVITPAPHLANKDILISRSLRSAANQALRAWNQKNTGVVGSPAGNRDESSGAGKIEQ